MPHSFACLLLAALAALPAGGQTLRVHHVDVGQGHCTLIVSPTGQTCLIDSGDFGMGAAVVVPLASSLGVTSGIDRSVLTHFHSDHWGGLPEVVAAGLAIGTAYDRGTAGLSGNVSAYFAAVGASFTLVPGQVLDLGGGATLTCVAANGVALGGGSVPVAGQDQEENARSVALRLAYGGYQEAIAGDLTGGGGGTPDVETLVAPVMGDVDVMVVNHHGSFTSTNAAWAAGLAAEVCVIPCGANNPYGHPHQATLDTLLAAPGTAAVYRLRQGSNAVGGTVVNGTLLVETDGATYTVSGGQVAPVTFPVDGPGPPPPPPPAGFLPGDVVVSEYMADPSAVLDSAGEWLELANTTAAAIDLAGFVVRDHGIDTFALPSLSIPARGRLVLARNGNPAQNGGVAASWVWPANAFFLANASDEIEIVAPSGAVLDTVVYDGGATFPDPTGASVERRDLIALPVAANFAAATVPFGSGDLGTPGASNSTDTTPPFVALTTFGALVPGGVTLLAVNGGAVLAGRAYLLGCSGGPDPGILLPAGQRIVPLVPDAVLAFSLTPGNGVFSGFVGTLGPGGGALGGVSLPAVPGLSGLPLHFSGVVLEAGAPDGVRSVVDALSLTVN